MEISLDSGKIITNKHIHDHHRVSHQTKIRINFVASPNHQHKVIPNHHSQDKRLFRFYFRISTKIPHHKQTRMLQTNNNATQIRGNITGHMDCVCTQDLTSTHPLKAICQKHNSPKQNKRQNQEHHLTGWAR